MTCVRAGVVLSGLLLCGASGYAQGRPVWEKSYPVGAQPTVGLEVSDSNLEIHPCGECRAVHIRVEMEEARLSEYRLEESQSGNTVHFLLKEKSHTGFHVGLHSGSVKVVVETPANLTLEARTSDGGLRAGGLHGDLSFDSSDGSQDLEDLSGNLKVRTRDGGVHLRGGRGTLEAQGADGSQEISGAFDSLQVSSSDGSLKVELLPGTRLHASSRITTRDGSLTVRVPRDLAAEFKVETRDGGISSDLPLAMNGYNSRGGDKHELRGTLNGGGSLLAIESSDGSVRLTMN
jgi:Putative adhesin